MAIDEYITTQKNASPLRAKIRDTTTRLDNLEKRMLPIVFVFNRLSPLIGQRSAELDVLNTFIQDPSNLINPFTDKTWAAQSRKETAYVCCEIRRNPKLTEEIQENLAAGKPALSDESSDKAMIRARAAAEGRTPPPDPDSAPAPVGNPGAAQGVPPPGQPGQFRQRNRPTSGLNTGIISGLPTPSAPSPAPAPAAAPAAAGQPPAVAPVAPPVPTPPPAPTP